MEFKHNEKAKAVGRFKTPKAPKINFRKHIGALARLKLEEVMSSVEGVTMDTLKFYDVRPRDLVVHRGAIRNALTSIIREDVGLANGHIKNTAITYASSLGYSELTEVLIGVSNDLKEGLPTRGFALDSICRLGGKAARRCLRNCAADHSPYIRERAIRGLEAIGSSAKDISVVTAVAKADPNLEVRRLAISALANIAPSVSVPKLAKKRATARHLRAEKNIPRAIGRANVNAPQTSFNPNGEEKAFGGREVVGEALSAALKVEQSATISYEVVSSTAEKISLRFRGHNVTALQATSLDTYKLSDTEVLLDFPAKRLRVGQALPISFTGKGIENPGLKWVPEGSCAPVILGLELVEHRAWMGKEFGLRIEFAATENARPSFLKLRLHPPHAKSVEIILPVSKQEATAGEKTVEGFSSNKTGLLEVEANLYCENGGAAMYRTSFIVLPTNPLRVNITPDTRGGNNKGPAHYNSSNKRFYCYARAEFVNGNPYPVAIGSNTNCRVTDAGTEKANFNFNTGTFAVPANGRRVMNLYVYFPEGNAVHNVFKDYGDVTMRFSFETSEGAKRDSAVWAAMAQVKLALNFVGNISGTDRGRVQSIVESEASGILEGQGIYISETRQFVLPTSHADYNRYRDIRLEENKDGGCALGGGEGGELRDDWSSPTPWLDVWIVESFSGPACAANILGFSPVNGPTSKSGSRSGLIIRMAGRNLTSTTGRLRTGIVYAHELGHFLGLPHKEDNNTNFMFPSLRTGMTNVTYSQFKKMVKHGFVERFVPGSSA